MRLVGEGGSKVKKEIGDAEMGVFPSTSGVGAFEDTEVVVFVEDSMVVVQEDVRCSGGVKEVVDAGETVNAKVRDSGVDDGREEVLQSASDGPGRSDCRRGR